MLETLGNAYSYTAGAISGYIPGACDWEEDVVKPTDEKLAKLFGISVESIRGKDELPEKADHKWTTAETIKWMTAKVARFAIKHPVISAAIVAAAGTAIAASAGSATAASIISSAASSAATVGSNIQATGAALKSAATGAQTYNAAVMKPLAAYLNSLTGVTTKTILNGLPSGVALTQMGTQKAILAKAAHAVMFMAGHPIVTTGVVAGAVGTHHYMNKPAEIKTEVKEKVVTNTVVEETQVDVHAPMNRGYGNRRTGRNPMGSN